MRRLTAAQNLVDSAKDRLATSGQPFVIAEQHHDPDAYERIREGPAKCGLQKMGSAAVTLSKDNLNAAHSSGNYSLQGCKGDAVVTAGKWYYEVRLDSNGQAQVGWCTQTYDAADSGSGGGDCWTYDGSKQQRVRNGNGVQWDKGQRWSSGDVIGVMLDLNVPSLRFSRNGQDMGEAFGPSELGTRTKQLSPCVILSR